MQKGKHTLKSLNIHDQHNLLFSAVANDTTISLPFKKKKIAILEKKTTRVSILLLGQATQELTGISPRLYSQLQVTALLLNT